MEGLSIFALSLSVTFFSIYTVAHAKAGVNRRPAVEKTSKKVNTQTQNIAASLKVAYK